VDEQELADAIGGSGEQVAAEAEQVAVAGVDAGDGVSAHVLHLVRDRDAGDGGPADVVIRDQEGAAHRGQDSDLVAACFRSGRTGGSISQTISNGRVLITATLGPDAARKCRDPGCAGAGASGRPELANNDLS